MKFRGFLIILFTIFVTIVFGQEKNELFAFEQNMQTMDERQWTPTLLNASSNVLYNTVMYNGRIFSWSIRGDNNSTTFLNGVNLSSPLSHLRGNDLYTGLQNSFHKEDLVLHGAFSENGYVAKPTVNYFSNEVIVGGKKYSVSTGISNSIYSNNITLNYQNGAGLNGIRQSYGLTFQQSEPSSVPIGYKKSFGFAYSIHKDFLYDRYLGFSILWNIGDQGKAATSVKETYVLTGQRTYSPNWGWYHQQFYYPSTKQTNAPVFLLNYRKRWSASSFLKIANAFIVGRQSESSIEWTKTADPRPDYYRYLPSYYADSNIRSSLTDWYTQHPELLQIQFDKLEKTNKASKDGRSYYIINQQNKDLILLHGSLLFSHYFKSNIQVQLGGQYLVDQIHYSNILKDLLGGTYYYNFNGWINDDGSVSSFQNDILHPDRKIKQGDQWGPDYAMRAIQFSPWIQLSHEGPRLETNFALGYGIQGLQRIGYNANGLYPSNSKERSVFSVSPSWDIKTQLLYKLNGRLYLRSILYGNWVSHDAEATYIDTDIHSITTPYLITRLEDGADLSLFYRAPAIKFSLSAYYKNSINENERKMFYQDAYASFVYGLVGKINKSFSGAEATLETSVVSNVQISIVSTIQRNIYLTNPNYRLISVNDLHLVESGILQIKLMPADNSPSFTSALNLFYQPSSSTRLGFTFVYAQERPIAIDLFRRSDAVKNKLDAYSWSLLSAPIFLADQGILNAFLSKSFQLKTKFHQARCNTSLSIRNMLNALVPVLAYEQSRFDYIHFNSNKYALKYLYDQGTSFSLRIQLQIQ